jgi:hypothetical protein
MITEADARLDNPITPARYLRDLWAIEHFCMLRENIEGLFLERLIVDPDGNSRQLGGVFTPLCHRYLRERLEQ